MNATFADTGKTPTTLAGTVTVHPHIHLIIPAGGLSEDRMEWIASPKKFFLSVKVLGWIFRGILCKNLAEVINKGDIFLRWFESFNGMEIYQEIISVHF